MDGSEVEAFLEDDVNDDIHSDDVDGDIHSGDIHSDLQMKKLIF